MNLIGLNINSSLFTVLRLSHNVTIILSALRSASGKSFNETLPTSSSLPTSSLSLPSSSSLPSPSSQLFSNLQDMISYTLNGYLTTFCVVTGIVLNIFCIIIFMHCRHGNAPPIIQYYLIALTIWQTLLLCNAFLLYSLPTLIYGRLISTGRYVYLYPYAYTLANVTHTGSVWIVLALTIDRYLALCRPLTHRAIGKRSRVKRLMVMVSLMAIIYSLPRFFEVQAVCLSIKEENNISCLPTVTRTELNQSQAYWQIYHIVLAMIFVTVVPCLLLFALTVRISLVLRKAYVRRKSLCASKIDPGKKKLTTRKEYDANIMLVLVIVKFLISDIFPTVADVLEHLVGDEAFMNSAFATMFVDISNFLLVLNCSTNFWVFIIYGKRFRQSVMQFMSAMSTSLRFCQWLNLEENKDVGLSTFTMVIGGTSSVKRGSMNINTFSEMQLNRSFHPPCDTDPSAPLLTSNGCLRKYENTTTKKQRHYSLFQPELTFRLPIATMYSGRSSGSISKVLLCKPAV